MWASIEFKAAPSLPTSVRSSVSRDPLREVAGGDRGGGSAHRLERPQAEAHDPEAEQRDPEQHRGGGERLDDEQAVEGALDRRERRGDHQDAVARARLDRGPHAVAHPAAHRPGREVADAVAPARLRGEPDRRRQLAERGA